MKLEKFKEKNPVHTGMIIVSTILVVLTAILILYKSFALYEQKNSFEIVNGQVPNQSYDAMFSFYVDDGEGNQSFVESIPTENGHNYSVTVSCDNGAKGQWDYAAWGPLITNVTTSRTKCNLIFKKGEILTTVAKVGDYVYYKPSKTIYTTNADYVGGNSYVTSINPSELTIWRIIKKNEDGSIEVVSENVSSKEVTVYGLTGYKNLIGQLNLIAKAYEDERYTVGSRHMGYSNQEEFITNITASNQNDTGYATDTNLIETALGTLVANQIGTTTPKEYWLASRISNSNGYGARYVTASGSVYNAYWCAYNSYKLEYVVRPILTLKSGLIVTGDGTSTNPFKIKE